MPSDLIVICTRNRPSHVQSLMKILDAQGSSRPALIVDSSDSDELKLKLPDTGFSVVYLHTLERSLARQRNIALDYATGHGFLIVHFIDDDSRPESGYFDFLQGALSGPSQLVGAGGTVVNQEAPKMVFAKRVFALYGTRPGQILRSGRNTIGHYPSTGGGSVDWLPGCAMSYRLDRIGTERFDDRLDGYSWGEDFDFSFRVGRNYPLAIVPSARVIHLVAPENRLETARLARERTILLHRWVSEHTQDGMKISLFWWSVAGEILLRLIETALLRRRTALETVRGVIQGIRAIEAR